MEQKENEQWWEDVGQSWFEHQNQPEKQESEDQLKQRLEQIERQLYQFQWAMFMQQLSNLINYEVSNTITSRPHLKSWEDDIRSSVFQEVNAWLQAKQAEISQNPEKAQEVTHEALISIVRDAVKKRADAIESKLKDIGITITTSMPVVNLPAEGAVSMGAPAPRTEEEQIPGAKIPLGEEIELYVVPESYIEQVRKKQLREYIRDRLALDEKRKQGGRTLMASSPQEVK